jgi:hypothetical protein
MAKLFMCISYKFSLFVILGFISSISPLHAIEISVQELISDSELRGQELSGELSIELLDSNYFSIGNSNILDVQKSLGKARIFRFEQTIGEDLFCYKTKESNIAVMFGSGAMGGWSTITSFRIGYFSKDILNKCSYLSPEVLNIKKHSKIKLGMSYTSFLDVFNTEAVSFRNDSEIEYNYYCKECNSKSSGIKAKFDEKNNLVYILIYCFFSD